MSQLTTNTTSIDECIALANALPDAGSGGGGSVETCSVEIDHGGIMMEAFGETIVNGQKLPYAYFYDHDDPSIMEASIVKGSYMILAMVDTSDMECTNCEATYLGTGKLGIEYYAVRIDGDAYILL